MIEYMILDGQFDDLVFSFWLPVALKVIYGCYYQSDVKKILQAVPEVSNEFSVVVGDDDLKIGPIVQKEVPVKG